MSMKGQIYKTVLFSPNLWNSKQKQHSDTSKRPTLKHLVSLAGAHSRRNVGRTFDYHKRESYAETTLE